MTRLFDIFGQYVHLLTPRGVAEIEIGLLLLGAFALGIVIVWFVSRASLRGLKKETKKATAGLMDAKEEYEKMRQEKEKVVQSFNSLKEDHKNIVEEYKNLKKENDKIKTEALSEKAKPFSMVSKLKDEIQELKEKIERLEIIKREHEELKNIYYSEREKHRAESRDLNNANQILRSEIEKQRRDLDSMYKENYSLTVLNNGMWREPLHTTTTPKPPTFAAPDTKEQDDLKQIRGIGAAIEAKLNNIGIFTIKQIASMTHDDIQSVTERIKFFPGRIERDNWVFQAKEILRVRGRKVEL